MASTSTLISKYNLSLSSHSHHSSSPLHHKPPLILKTSKSSQFYTFPTSNMHYDHQTLAPLLSRRLFLPSVSGIWDAITGGGGNSRQEALLAVRRGMLLFRQGDVAGSVMEFDKAIELDPRQKIFGRGGYRCIILIGSVMLLKFLSARGGLVFKFEEGAEQFRIDVAQNPNDTEESIWCFLCEAQLYGVDEARRRFLEVGRDSRPVMRESYNMFKDGGDPEKLVSTFLGGKGHEYFYASLYAGLYYESQNDKDAAERHILAACQSPYGSSSDDYMAALAKVHCLCRNWSTG